MVSIVPGNCGIEINTLTCGISGRIWLDLDEAKIVRGWLVNRLDELISKAADQAEKVRQDEIRRLRERLSVLETTPHPQPPGRNRDHERPTNTCCPNQKLDTE